MQSYRVTGVNHTSFTVENIVETVAFFRDCLGAEVISVGRPANPLGIPRITGVDGAAVKMSFVRIGAHLVEFLEYEAPASRAAVYARPCDVGFAHLALNVDGLAQLVDQASTYGYRLVGEVIEVLGGPDKGRKAAYIRGPDGITVELVGT